MAAHATKKTQRTAMGLRPVGEAVSRLAGTPIRRRGLAEAKVVTDWPRIVGEALARHTCPERLVQPRRGTGKLGGTLHLRVAGAMATELQHLEPLVLERINGYFGYRAVTKLRITQAPLPVSANTEPVAKPVATAAEAEEVDRLVSPVGDELIRESLAALGRALAAHKNGSE